MLYTPHPKQQAVHDSPARFKVLNWGRQCFIKGTLVSTPNGPIPIQDIREGQLVYSYSGKTTQLKKVEQVHMFGVDSDPKPMIQLLINGKTITSTYDHEYYVDNRWVPAYQLAWGVLAPSQRKKLELLCKQYGKATNNTLQGWLPNSSNETSYRWVWVLADSRRRQNRQTPSTNSPNFYTKPQEQATSQSQERGQARQSSREPGVGNIARKYISRLKEWAKSPKVWRKLNQQDNRAAGYGDIASQKAFQTVEPSPGESTSNKIPPQTRFNKRYLKRQELVISSAKVLTCKPSYDLTVADNHNYVVEDILVHNTGKSMFALQYTLYEALRKQGRYWIVLPTYRQAKDIYWKQYVKAFIPKELVHKLNDVDLSITLKYIEDEKNGIKHDTKLPASTIELKGSDSADLLRGAKVNGFVFDEYAYHDADAWRLVFEPMLLTTKGWAMFISTPNGFNHFYDLANRAQTDKKWFYSHASPYDNPYIGNEEIERIKQEVSEDQFAQEYMAEFRKMAGLVYKEFDRKIHVVKPEDVPKVGTRLIGIDFGYVNPTAAVFILIDGDNNWWIYDEIYERQKTMDQIAEHLKEKMVGVHITMIVADSAQAEHIANLNNKGLPVYPVSKTKDSINAGIELIKSRLKTYEQLTGKPKPHMFISNNCPNVIEEFEKYHYPEATRADKNEKEEPIKKDDHAMDALRYITLAYQMGPYDESELESEDLFTVDGFYR